jgi:TetR/AcrR family transcriptional repressor of lmrAB and yxaGH operons
MNDDSRAAMVSSAAALIAAHGMNATSFSEVLADSGAPRGSIYHHFPDGKKELVTAAVHLTAESVLAYMRAHAADTPDGVLRTFVGLWRHVVNTSGGSAGCAVAGVAIDLDPTDVDLIEAVRSTFRSWTDLLAEQLDQVGIPRRQAEPVALMALAAMEGALILCRAQGNAEPLDTIEEQLLRLLPLP